MKRLLLIIALSLGVAAAAVAAEAKIGVILMHGKLGASLGAVSGRGGVIGARLIAALRDAGYLVAAPEMCWSRRRSFDKTYPECLREIDDVIGDLKSQGATGIVVGGLSLGGNAALAYGSSHPELLGIVALAPADNPRSKAKRPEVAAAIAQAQELTAKGRSDDSHWFDDVNTGAQGTFAMQLRTTPRIYLSFFGPDSTASIPDNTARLTQPLLWVAGEHDPSQQGGRAFAFDKAPANPLNRYVTVAGGHLDTPDAARETVLEWLRAVRQAQAQPHSH
jgi:pimeloyl-ACP methyl ester carboxylesterase